MLGVGNCGIAQSPTPNSEQERQTFQKTVQPFLVRYCFDCHTDKQRGGVRLDRLEEKSLSKHLPTLEKVLDVLDKRVMPPPTRTQPSSEELRPVMTWLEAYVEQETTGADRVLIRRLNRVEYNNTLRDLLGVNFQPADDFPQDTPGHGFDNIAGTLSVSPVLMEKYLAAAEKAARTAVFGVEPLTRERVVHEPWFAADAFSKNEKVLFDYDETGMSLPSAFHVVQRFPADGEYTLRGILRGVRPAGCDPIEVGFWIDGKLVHTAKIPILAVAEPGRNAGEVNGLWAEFRTPMKAGEHWLSATILRMYEGLPPQYKGPKPAKPVETGGRGSTNKAVDAFFVMYLHVVGPYNQVLGPSPESIRKLYGNHPVKGSPDAATVRKIVTDLARRAYRRPVTDREVDELVRLIERVQRDGESFEEGLCLAIQRLLISPHFLFRVERTPQLTQHELATRLSYFLWSSLPDEELFRCADEGKLRQPEVLEAQVRRMLRDDRAGALVENFGGQWLRTRALESHLPDRNAFPEFTDYTRMSMKQETERFFEYVLREDRPILDFVEGQYTFLNQRLAEFYGIRGVKGHEFRKVDLTGSGRGGVWRHASVLTVSSYPNRTSPVLRGKWILENLLNAPPPPPPPDVPALEEKELGKSVSLREQLARHRSNAACVSCHVRMDPLGLALERFDAIGRWRDRDGTLPIDDAATLADGRAIKGPDGLAAVLKADPKAFAECLAEKLLTYALGRGLDRSDRKTLKALVQRLADEDYHFSSLVLGIVRSEAFQTRK